MESLWRRWVTTISRRAGIPRSKLVTRVDMRVTVIGTGYVGTVTGACLAYLGHRVTCVDTDLSKIAKLRLGQPPIFEPGLEELLVLANDRGGMNFETDLEGPVRESDVIFIAVGTPPLP